MALPIEPPQLPQLPQPLTPPERIINNPDIPMVPVGISGLKRYGGYVYEEFLRELSGAKGRKVYAEMAANDAICGGILFAIEHLSRNVEWRVEPFDSSPDNVQRADFVRDCLMNDLHAPWPDILAEILSMLTFGWSLFEITYKRRVGYLGDHLMSSQYQDGMIGWREFGQRSQETLDQWGFNEEGYLEFMRQSAPPDHKERIIPMRRSMLFRTTTHHNNPEGLSILRRAYRSWIFKKRIQEIEGIGVERDLAGLPVLTAPEKLDLWNQNDPNMVTRRRQAEEIIRSIRRDEQEGVLLPFGWMLTLLSTGGRRQMDTSPIITRYNTEIAQTTLADFMMLGHDQVGSYALASSKTHLFSFALGSFLNAVAAQINRRAIPGLMAANGWARMPCPKLVHGDIEDRDLAQLSDYISKLSAAGFPMFPSLDGRLEQELLLAAKLPTPEDPDTFRQMVEQEKAEERERMAVEMQGGEETADGEVVDPSSDIPPEFISQQIAMKSVQVYTPEEYDAQLRKGLDGEAMLVGYTTDPALMNALEVDARMGPLTADEQAIVGRALRDELLEPIWLDESGGPVLRAIGDFDAAGRVSKALRIINRPVDLRSRGVHVSVWKGGAGSGHFKHEGIPGQRGGSEPSGRAASSAAPDRSVHVGITSYREGKSNKQVFAEMRDFQKALSSIPTVRNVKVQPAQGMYLGAQEPSWVVEYEGNGDAENLLKATRAQYNQDAILLVNIKGLSTATAREADAVFPRGTLKHSERAQINKSLVENGIVGWTWFKSGGNSVLRVVGVPQWDDSLAANPDEIINRLNKSIGTGANVRIRAVTPTIIDKDAVAKGSAKSGHYGHRGVPGQRGGSAPSGGGSMASRPKKGHARMKQLVERNLRALAAGEPEQDKQKLLEMADKVSGVGIWQNPLNAIGAFEGGPKYEQVKQIFEDAEKQAQDERAREGTGVLLPEVFEQGTTGESSPVVESEPADSRTPTPEEDPDAEPEDEEQDPDAEGAWDEEEPSTERRDGIAVVDFADEASSPPDIPGGVVAGADERSQKYASGTLENVEELGGGVSRSYTGYIDGEKSVYKPDDGDSYSSTAFTGGLREAYTSYVDQEFATKIAAISVWRADVQSDVGQLAPGSIAQWVPGEKGDDLERDTAERMIVLDLLSGNVDRHSGNWVGQHAVDHNRTFTSHSFDDGNPLAGLSPSEMSYLADGEISDSVASSVLASLNDEATVDRVIARGKELGMSDDEEESFRARINFVAEHLEAGDLLSTLRRD